MNKLSVSALSAFLVLFAIAIRAQQQPPAPKRGPEPAKLAADFGALNALLHWPRSRVHRSRDRLLLRDALVALDGRRASANHREVAELIFGMERVREAWSGRGGWLKERMRRALATGEKLRDGGYRIALEGSCRFSR